MIKDAKRAGVVAKEYFQEVHGWLSTIDFQATEISHIEEEAQWLVKCSYSTSFLSEGPRVTYELRITDDERVVSVKKLNGR